MTLNPIKEEKLSSYKLKDNQEISNKFLMEVIGELVKILLN